MPKLKLEGAVTGDPVAFSSSYREIGQFRGLFTTEVTQLGTGDMPGSIRGCVAKAVGVVHSEFAPEAIMNMELPRDCIVFSLPLSNADRWKVNGLHGDARSMILHTGQDAIFGRGEGRHALGAGLQIDRFLDDFAALTGQVRETAALPSGRIGFSASEKAAFVRLLKGFIDQAHPPRRDDALRLDISDREIIHLTARFAARTWQETAPRERLRGSALRLVQAAERRFASETDSLPSLAELCRAAGVSAPALTAAFQDCVGVPPIRYFTLKRLTRARAELVAGRYDRAPVKQAAMGHGFRELGKFSRLYWSVFGELPSETERRHRHSRWM